MAAGKLRPQKRCPLFLHKGMQISPNAEWTLRTDPHGAHTHFILKHALGVPPWCEFPKEKQAQLMRPTRTALMGAFIDGHFPSKSLNTAQSEFLLVISSLPRVFFSLIDRLWDLSRSFNCSRPKQKDYTFQKLGKKSQSFTFISTLVSPVDKIQISQNNIHQLNTTGTDVFLFNQWLCTRNNHQVLLTDIVVQARIFCNLDLQDRDISLRVLGNNKRSLWLGWEHGAV